MWSVAMGFKPDGGAILAWSESCCWLSSLVIDEVVDQG